MTTYTKPRVGIIYSYDEQNSCESKNLAHYFCGLLSASGYANLFMIPHTGNMVLPLPNQRISYLPKDRVKPVEVPVSDVTYGYWNVVSNCHVLIITVNTYDTEACCKRILEELKGEKKPVAVFCLQRGVRNSANVKDGLSSNKNLAVIEGFVGFAAVLDAKTSAFTATLPNPGLVFERLSREVVGIAEGPLNLLETMKVSFSYRKVITPIAWGTLIFENLYVLNILTKGSLVDTLAKREWRLILALMVRESYKILETAARGGRWKPDLLVISRSLYSTLVLELILVLPTPFTWLILYFLNLMPRPGIISPGQLDIATGRKSMASYHFSELVDAAKRYEHSAPTLHLVMTKIKALEDHLEQQLKYGSMANLASSYSGDCISEVEKEVREYMRAKGHPSVKELWFWITRAVTAVSVVVLLLFLFLHEF